MEANGDDKIVYSINVRDIQEVADQILKRRLTKKEAVLIERSVGDYIDWSQAIENAIRQHISGGWL